MRVHLKYVHEDVDRHGRVRIYVRRRPGAPKIRLRARPGTAEFLAEYERGLLQSEAGVLDAARRPTLGPTAGTLGWLATRWLNSAGFRALDPTTQRTRTLIVQSMLAEPIKPGSTDLFADFPLEHIRRRSLAVLRDRKALAGKPEAGNMRVRVLRAIWKWALAEEIVETSPAREVELLAAKGQGHHTWTLAEIAAFEARHPRGTKARLALDLMLYSGCRISDAARLGRQHIKGDRLQWTAYKGRHRRQPSRIDIPILPPLAAALATAPSGGLVFLARQTGAAHSTKGLGNWFRDRCDEAGLPHCSAHGLRKAAATRCAEAGASAHELMAIFGWQTLAQAEVYTRAASRAQLAASGLARLRESPLSQSALSPPRKKHG